MKYLVIITHFLLLSLVSNAQDTILPAEISKIYLHSGKNINKVTLWKIDSVSVEYVKDGNLADISTSDVLRIESLNYRIEFDENNKMISRKYDLIILENEDTIRGIIKNINNNSVSYIAAGKNNLPLFTRNFHSYIVRNDLYYQDRYETIPDSIQVSNPKKNNVNSDGKQNKTKPAGFNPELSFKNCCIGTLGLMVAYIMVGALFSL